MARDVSLLNFPFVCRISASFATPQAKGVC